MNINKTIYLGISLLALSLSACGVKNSFPLSGKTFSYSKCDEISVDSGFYDVEDSFNGSDKDGFATIIKNMTCGSSTSSFDVSDAPVTNYSYKGQTVKAYQASFTGTDGETRYPFLFVESSEENKYHLVTINSDKPGEYKDYAPSLGYSQRSHYDTGVTTHITHSSDAKFSTVTYNKEDKTLTTRIDVTDVYTVDDDSTTLHGSFTFVWKA